MSGNGHVIPSTPISIDMWNTKAHPQARVFFLSHFHGDHIVGLSSTWQYPIYASPITCQFLIKKLRIRPSLVKSLEIGEDHLIPLDGEHQEMVTVTLFDANHCPGSVMFLFSGYFGDVFYTGDFRYKPGLVDSFALPPIDVLYLDNTYCSPKCLFPTREDAIENILSQLHTCLVESQRVFIGLDNLGKEDLLERIVKERQFKVNVYPARKELMDIMGLSEIITADRSNTRIFVVPTNQISGKNLERWNNEMKTHAILATARFCGLNFKPFSKHPDIHVIPYSNHSSYFELKEFVKLVKPRCIVPIVGKHAKGIFNTDISERSNMGVFQKFLRDASPSEYVIPESVKKVMNAAEAKFEASVPLKKRKIARPQRRPWRKPPAVGVRYIVSEDSATDSDPDAIHMETKKFASENISEFSCENILEYSSPDISDESDIDTPVNVWEITHISGKGSRSVYYINDR
ncbi:hypothetical protein JTE90_000184 [Oedothorax gibbosus]|uniref:5' exonuclease Apollo n=1 Tax=Oedothorax gibbosus TaxID=931172 RepID=A0AAV6UV82_9ARAC|nr:hypothetical protein JTE90_000184 [Oedothorax gibbosus]